MNGNRSGTTVLITGCSSGFGRCLAEYLKKKGYRVLATARREEDVKTLSQSGQESFLLDLNSSDSIKSAVRDIIASTGGRLDVLVNNAGLAVMGAVEDLSRAAVRQQFETNLFGALELTALLIPVFRKTGQGKIIFISSPNSNGFGYPFLGIEAASKSALETAAVALRRELRGSGIWVSTVCPGEFHTGLFNRLLAEFSKNVNPENSVHRERYQRLIENFSQPETDSRKFNLVPVAEAVRKIIESKNPPRRVLLPLGTRIHYLAHVFLPEWLQDLFLFRKMKKKIGIDM